MLFFFSFVFYPEVFAHFYFIPVGSLRGNGVHASGNLPGKGKTAVGENSKFGQSLQSTVK